MTDKDKPAGLEVKKMILEDLGITKERLERINTLEDAEILLKYLEGKDKAGPEGILKLKSNIGHEGGELPPPEEVKDKVKMNFLERLNPVHVKHAYDSKSRYNKNARILFHWNEVTGDPEVF